MRVDLIPQLWTNHLFPDWSDADDSIDLRRRERTLAIARVFLSVASLVAIYLDPTEPSRFARVAYILLLAYLGYSVAILLSLRGRRRITHRLQLGIHATSLLWAAVISLFTSGPSSAFFVFFIFVILAAGYRWRMRESLITTAILVLILLGQAALYRAPLTAHFLGADDFGLNRVIMRGAYLLIVGAFAGLLGEKEKQFSYEIAVINKLLRRIRVEQPVELNFESLANAARQIFRAHSVLLVWHVIGDDRYQTVRATGTSAVCREISRQEGRKLFCPLESVAVMVRAIGQDLVANVAEDASNCCATEKMVHGNRGILAAEATAGDDWRVRIFVIAPYRNSLADDPSGFLERMLTQLVPSIHNSFLVKRMREQVGAMERAKIARELHDGPIQALSSARLQLSTVRTKVAPLPGALQDIDRISDIIGCEVLNLRDLIQHLRSSNVKPEELISAIIDHTERFERETGITVRLARLPENVALPAKACSEILYILREALINIRKHSRATTVLVALDRDEDTWHLTVDDDGAGFPFEGHISWDELQHDRKGPIVIKERVKLLGGELEIHSSPGNGSRLEIAIPMDKALSDV